MLLLNAAACPSECSQCSQNLFFSSFISIQILFSCLFTSEQIVFITALCNVSSSGQHMYQVPYVFNTLMMRAFCLLHLKTRRQKSIHLDWSSSGRLQLDILYIHVMPLSFLTQPCPWTGFGPTVWGHRLCVLCCWVQWATWQPRRADTHGAWKPNVDLSVLMFFSTTRPQLSPLKTFQKTDYNLPVIFSQLFSEI